MWLNNTKVLKDNLKKDKPCHKCGYCPYGAMVEMFPLIGGKLRCELFGHDCPMFYNAEDVSEQEREEIIKKIYEAKKDVKSNS